MNETSTGSAKDPVSLSDWPYRQLPTMRRADGRKDIDWDAVVGHYLKHVLSPFASQMCDGDGRNPRNRVLDYIYRHAEWFKDPATRVADMGCGPGLLVHYAGHCLSEITLVDASERALDLARIEAERQNVKANLVQADIRELDTSEQTFDVVFSVNSILPPHRRDVVSMLTRIRESLAPEGRLLAILPSYDTTLYLLNLWVEHYRSMGASEAGIRKLEERFRSSKLMDDRQRLYADDEHNVQSYHDPETIKTEFNESGLKLMGEPEKVYYPWKLTKKYDYGYFPDAKEEIWDWFVIAGRQSQT